MVPGCVTGLLYGSHMDLYLDCNATTPPDPAVVEAMLPYLTDRFGNAASAHPRGRAAAFAVERARDRVADLLGVASRRIVWTSGATEAINTALKGLAETRAPGRGRLLVGATEHKAVLDTAEWLSWRRGVRVDVVPVDVHGRVDLDALGVLLGPDVFAVAVMGANNETGVVNPVGDVRSLAAASGASYVCDATQMPGKVACALSEVDYVAVSAHKVYGPQGVGALVIPPAHQGIDALVHGGGHERGLRSGTLNLAGVVGFGVAAELAVAQLDVDRRRLAGLRDRLVGQLGQEIGGVSVHGAAVARLPNTASVRLAGVDADALIVGVPEVAFSSGSACTSAVPTPSHVLTAMGLSDAEASETVRLSLGRSTSEADVDAAVGYIAAAAARLRELNGAA
jgi:cysteine desulfurase